MNSTSYGSSSRGNSYRSTSRSTSHSTVPDGGNAGFGNKNSKVVQPASRNSEQPSTSQIEQVASNHFDQSATNSDEQQATRIIEEPRINSIEQAAPSHSDRPATDSTEQQGTSLIEQLASSLTTAQIRMRNIRRHRSDSAPPTTTFSIYGSIVEGHPMVGAETDPNEPESSSSVSPLPSNAATGEPSSSLSEAVLTNQEQSDKKENKLHCSFCVKHYPGKVHKKEPSLICPGCGPFINVRYCCATHLLADAGKHYEICGNMQAAGSVPESQLSTDVQTFVPYIPATEPQTIFNPVVHSLELYRQMAYLKVLFRESVANPYHECLEVSLQDLICEKQC